MFSLGPGRAGWNALGNVQEDRWLVTADGQSEGLRTLIMGVRYVAQLERSNWRVAALRGIEQIVLLTVTS